MARNEANIRWEDIPPPLPEKPRVIAIDPTEKFARSLITALIADSACNTRQFSETPTVSVENVVVGITKGDVVSFASQPMARFDLGVQIEMQPRASKISPGILNVRPIIY